MKTLELKSKIDEVTVYTDRARVLRRANGKLSKGEVEVTVDHLPVHLDENSFRVTGQGLATFKIMGVRLHKEYSGTPDDRELKKLQSEIRKYEDVENTLGTKRKLLDEKNAYFRKMLVATERELAKNIARKKANVDDGQTILDFYFGNIDRITKELEALSLKMRTNAEKLEGLRWQWERLETPQITEVMQATVSLLVEKGGNFDIDLTYNISGASWKPVYDLRFDIEKSLLNLTYRAAVWQQTGEDWDDVTLRLSTAKPQAGANPPELYPWYLDFYRPMTPQPKARAGKAKKEMAKALAVEEDMGDFVNDGSLLASASVTMPPMMELEQSPQPADVPSAGVSGEGPTVTFIIPGSPSVPADSDPRYVSIAEHNFPANITYVLVPAFEKVAFIRSRSTNESEFTLLPGATNIFRGDEFVGRGELELVNPGVEFDSYLGVDERVHAEYESRRLDADSQGLIGKKDRVTIANKCEVSSDIPEEVEIIVKDRRPVPTNKDIKIKINKCTPEPAEDKDNGLIEWQEKIKKDSKVEFNLEYVIEYPEDKEISGL